MDVGDQPACIILMPSCMCCEQWLALVIVEQGTCVQLSINSTRPTRSQLGTPSITQEAGIIRSTIKSEQLQVYPSELAIKQLPCGPIQHLNTDGSTTLSQQLVANQVLPAEVHAAAPLAIVLA
jgi:hypothetical protein